MLKKSFVTLSALIFSTTSAYAWYTVGVCYNKDHNDTMQYVCFTNTYWGSPL